MTDTETPMPDGAQADLDVHEDDGTMPDNVDTLRQSVIGRRIVSVERGVKVPQGFTGEPRRWVYGSDDATVITLDNGRRVTLIDTADCCAYTELQEFLLHPDKVDHAILGVGTTDGYTKWHIFADYGDVLELTVGWSCGNPFYYAYGFTILVEEMGQ